jgi:RNA polymerase-binding transcription factor DksA
MATGIDHDVAVDRLTKRPVEQADLRLVASSNRAIENPDAAATSTSAPPDQRAPTVAERAELRRRLEELAALEANRIERVAAIGSEPLDASEIGIRSDVHDALAKMTDGTYGDCETCQSLIPVARLTAVPYARRCLACQEREENGWHHVQRLVGGVPGDPAGEPLPP